MSGFLKMKFLRVCPYGKVYLEKLVGECKREILLLSLLVIPLLYAWNSLFGVCSVTYLMESIVLALYLIFIEIPNYRLYKKENMVYRELLIYFSRVKHRYLVCRNGANAILDAADGMQYEIVCLAEEIYRILLECNRKEKIRECILFHPLNRYLKMFLLQVYGISEKGDMYFAENIEHLRIELMEEIYRRKERTHKFSGYVFITIVPFFAMPVLKQWGMAFSPEMELFYESTGKLLETITFGATFFIYGMILRAKEIDLQENDNKSKLWNSEMIYNNRFVDGFIRYIERVSFGRLSSKMQKLILQSGEKISYGRLWVKILFSGFGAIIFLEIMFGDFWTCLAGGICIGVLPIIKLYFQGQRIRDGAVHEVRQFQAVLLMERKLQGVTVVDLLEDMELFSKCFRNCLRRCINSYSSDPGWALQRLKEEGNILHPSFGELADSFLSVDEAGVELSFAEVENNRRLLDRMTKLETEIHMERKKDSTDLVSRIPVILTVGIYFIFPVFGYSLHGVYEVFRLLEGMGG